MTPCAPEAHILRVVELDPDPTTPLIVECERCLTMIPVAPIGPEPCWRSWGWSIFQSSILNIDISTIILNQYQYLQY